MGYDANRPRRSGIQRQGNCPLNRARVLILGGTGMLGHKMFQVLREHFDGVVCSIRGSKADMQCSKLSLFSGRDVLTGVDATRVDELRDLVRRIRPHVVVNCVGLIKQRPEAVCPVPLILVNSLLPHHLEAMVREFGGRLIHFSTDCVFSGRRGSYSEDDPSDAEDLYGRSKFLGEVAGPKSVTLRTSIIGRELTCHRSLLDWFLSQSGKTVRGFQRVVYSGVTTNYLAEVVVELITKHSGLSGLYQVVSEPISKCALLTLIQEAYRVDVTIQPDDTEICDRSMLGAKFEQATQIRCPSWPELVRRLAADQTPYERWSF
jgi:dTDP-4-dehydrorhamnose reductase